MRSEMQVLKKNVRYYWQIWIQTELGQYILVQTFDIKFN
jgi:hypothetical protein